MKRLTSTGRERFGFDHFGGDAWLIRGPGLDLKDALAVSDERLADDICKALDAVFDYAVDWQNEKIRKLIGANR